MKKNPIYCAFCAKTVALRNDGSFRVHRRHDGTLCPESGADPVTGARAPLGRAVPVEADGPFPHGVTGIVCGGTWYRNCSGMTTTALTAAEVAAEKARGNWCDAHNGPKVAP